MKLKVIKENTNILDASSMNVIGCLDNYSNEQKFMSRIMTSHYNRIYTFKK